MVKTFDEIQAFFNNCKAFWMNKANCSESEAESRALWWDCKECWDFDKSWTEEKQSFFDGMKDSIPLPKEG